MRGHAAQVLSLHALQVQSPSLNHSFAPVLADNAIARRWGWGSLFAVIFYSFVSHWIFSRNGWLNQVGVHPTIAKSQYYQLTISDGGARLRRGSSGPPLRGH